MYISFWWMITIPIKLYYLYMSAKIGSYQRRTKIKYDYLTIRFRSPFLSNFLCFFWRWKRLFYSWRKVLFFRAETSKMTIFLVWRIKDFPYDGEMLFSCRTHFPQVLPQGVDFGCTWRFAPKMWQTRIVNREIIVNFWTEEANFLAPLVQNKAKNVNFHMLGKIKVRFYSTLVQKKGFLWLDFVGILREFARSFHPFHYIYIWWGDFKKIIVDTLKHEINKI